MKKVLKYLAAGVGVLAVLFLYYYISLPALNIHAAGFWYAVLFLLVALMVLLIVQKGRKVFSSGKEIFSKGGKTEFFLRDVKGLKVLLGLTLIVFLIYLAGLILSSPFINAARYQQLLTIEKRSFSEDIKEVDYNTIPLLDRNSAALLGQRKMGSMVDMVSQFEVSNDYSQINYQGRPVRVTPLAYANTIKWLTNQSNGIPAYIRIDMATQDTECVKLSEGIRYSKSELFNRNIYRHLRFHFPTYIFDDQIFFEINEGEFLTGYVR